MWANILGLDCPHYQRWAGMFGRGLDRSLCRIMGRCLFPGEILTPMSNFLFYFIFQVCMEYINLLHFMLFIIYFIYIPILLSAFPSLIPSTNSVSSHWNFRRLSVFSNDSPSYSVNLRLLWQISVYSDDYLSYGDSLCLRYLRWISSPTSFRYIRRMFVSHEESIAFFFNVNVLCLLVMKIFFLFLVFAKLLKKGLFGSYQLFDNDIVYNLLSEVAWLKSLPPNVVFIKIFIFLWLN